MRPTPSIPFPYPYRAQPYLIPPADTHTRTLTTLMFRAGVEAHTVTTQGIACYAQNLVEVSRIPVLHYITLTPAARPPHTHQRPRRPSLSTLIGCAQASDDVQFCENVRRERMRRPFRIECWMAAERAQQQRCPRGGAAPTSRSTMHVQYQSAPLRARRSHVTQRIVCTTCAVFLSLRCASCVAKEPFLLCVVMRVR